MNLYLLTNRSDWQETCFSGWTNRRIHLADTVAGVAKENFITYTSVRS